MEYLNVTPHDLNVITEAGNITIPASGTIARVSVVSKLIDDSAPIPMFEESYGNVVDLPDPEDGVVIIASVLVCAAVSDRKDVWHPGQLVRNDAGQPVGCRGLARIV